MEDLKSLQVRLEQQEQTNRTLNEINSSLRSQLEQATKTNQTLFTYPHRRSKSEERKVSRDRTLSDLCLTANQNYRKEFLDEY